MKNVILKNSMIFLVIVFILCGIFLRIMGLEHVSGDMNRAFVHWYHKLVTDGFYVVQTEISSYNPPYLYLLWIATRTRGFIPEVTAIKLISILFDVGIAFLVYLILKIKYHEGDIPLLGAAVSFVLPTIILNSAWWGQSDSIYTFFVLASLYFILRNHPLIAMASLGVAISFKLQAVFFAPFLFLMLLKRRISWKYFLVTPIAYVGMLFPAMVAGSPFSDILTIYFSQADDFQGLTRKAPNLYQFISNRWHSLAIPVGVGLTALLVFIWAISCARKIKKLTPEVMIMCMAVSTIMVPFFLPKMHERYFYLADITLLLLAFFLPRLWFVPLVSQIVSTLTYLVYLLWKVWPGRPYGISRNETLIFATLLNLILVLFLFWEQYRLIVIKSPSAIIDD